MKNNKTVLSERKRHQDALADLARSLGVKNPNGLTLWRQLRRIEIQARRAATDYCNGQLGSQEMGLACERAEDGVRRVFGGTLPPRFHVNSDPRGYALQLLSNDNGTEAATPFGLEQDCGPNQLLAPDIE